MDRGVEKPARTGSTSDNEVEFACVSGCIRAAPEAIWTLLVDFNQPQRLAPSIESCEGLGLGEGSVRRVCARARTIYEQLVEADPEAFVFRYVVLPSGDMPYEGIVSYQATVRLRPITAELTAVEWRSVGRLAKPLPPIRAALEALYTRAIENMRAGLEDRLDAPG